jgi:two-component system response regulator YesN
MYKVMLVDDEPLILEGLSYIVSWEEHGFEIAGVARSAEEALTLMENSHVDLLLTDIRMPGLSGIDLIERVQALNRNTKFVILSGFNDFELVKTAAKLGIENYLIKPINKEELSSTLVSVVAKLDSSSQLASQQIYVREAIDILRDNVILRLATGNIGIHEYAEKSSFLNLRMDGSHYAVAMIRRIKDNLTSRWKETPQLLNFAIRNICLDTLASAESTGISGYAVNDMDEDITLVLTGNLASNEDALLGLLREIIHNCFGFLKQDIFISLGNFTDSWHDLSQSYRTAKDLADYSLVLTDKGLITSNEAQAQKGNLGKTFQDDFDKLQHELLSGNRASIAERIRSIFKKVDITESKSPALVHNVTVEMLFRIVHVTNLSQRSESSGILGRKEFLVDVLSRTTLVEIADAIIEAIEDILLQSDARDSRIEEILAYANTHYMEDLSLFQLSALFHINAAYLGQLFKKETGKLFTTYLNEYRVSKAIELLQSSPLKAKEVAVKVGYANPDYFYKIFKKITGKYPSEYS